jgi:UDP-N-acetylglucosamine:LPS N-acetylglucosamine transferase
MRHKGAKAQRHEGEFRNQNPEFRIQETESRIQEPESRSQESEFRTFNLNRFRRHFLMPLSPA